MRRGDAYAARHRFCAPARRYSDVWRIVMGMIVIETVWTLTYVYVLPVDPYAPGTTGNTLLIHTGFLSLTLSAFWVVRRLQGRAPGTLFGPVDRLITDFAATARAMVIFFVVLNLALTWDWSGIALNMAPVKWALLLPVGLVAVLIQVSAEEIVFRGFLQQSLGARFDNPVLWLVLPSALFGFAHYDPNLPPDAATAYMIWAFCFGLAAADLTARSGSLGAAIGLHFVTNVLSIVVFSEPGPLSGFALFVFEEDPATMDHNWFRLVFDIFYLWMTWMVCRIAIRR